MTPRVSVVIPFYDDQPRLELVLAGLAAQQTPAGGFEVIVADDGSPHPPAVAEQPFAIRVVRQPDQGFRAAAARNLGATHAHGEVLCFLDADTVPTPQYLSRIVAACDDGRTVAVGRREHVDLTGWDPRRLRRAWTTGADVPHLADPTWLAEGYRATENLTCADDTSFRYVISAVLAMPRALFERVGGFDGSFVGYGGEDWDLANRCWLAGADFRHVPDAVAWHDGPDAAARPDFIELKNHETLTLAKVLTHPLVRGTGLVHAVPDVAVELDVTGWDLGRLTCCVQSLLAGSDAGVWVSGGDPPPLDDPRVHRGTIPARVLARCRYRVRSADPVVLRGATLSEAVAAAPTGPCPARVVTTREANRARNRQVPVPWRPLPTELVQPLPDDVVIERWRTTPP